MPITFSHPLAIIPLARKPFVVSALVIGSMAPDFTHFVNIGVTYEYAHTLQGIFAYCLPISLISYLIFHVFLKLPMLSLLPIIDQVALQKLAVHKGVGSSLFFAIVLSIIVGAITHICWDSFTHSYGWMVRHFDWLKTVLISTPIGNLSIFKALQYSGHLLGLPLILMVYSRWIRKGNSGVDEIGFLRGWVFLVVKLILIQAVIFVLSLGVFSVISESGSFYQMIGSAVKKTLTIDIVIIFGYSVIWHISGILRKHR